MPEKLPLLLIPGLLCDAALWLHQRRVLAGQRRVQMIDHSTSGSIVALATTILRAAPPRFAIAGLSMGGYIVLEVARQAPDRVVRLALLDTNAHDDPPEAQERRQGQIEEAEAGRFDAVVESLLPALIAPANLSHPEVAGTMRAMAHRAGPAVFIRQQRAIMARRDQQALLPQLPMPTLVLCGALDALTPPAKHEQMAAALPNAQLVIVPGAGHLAPLEAPEPVTQAMLEWLEG